MSHLITKKNLERMLRDLREKYLEDNFIRGTSEEVYWSITNGEGKVYTWNGMNKGKL